jgi:hypothetical protein
LKIREYLSHLHLGAEIEDYVILVRFKVNGERALGFYYPLDADPEQSNAMMFEAMFIEDGWREL